MEQMGKRAVAAATSMNKRLLPQEHEPQPRERDWSLVAVCEEFVLTRPG